MVKMNSTTTILANGGGLEVELIRPTSPHDSGIERNLTNSSPNRNQVDLLVADGVIEVDNEGAQHTHFPNEETVNMPPAPFQRNSPPSPIEEEEGMEALWVEEPVSPSPKAEEEEVTVNDDSHRGLNKRRSSFFHRRMGSGGLPWNRRQPKEETQPEQAPVEATSRKTKVHTSVKVLEDNDAAEPELELPRKTKVLHSNNSPIVTAAAPSPMEQRQSSFGKDKEQHESEPRETVTADQKERIEQTTAAEESRSASVPQSLSNASVQSETTKAISVKSNKARELLAAALHADTELPEREGLAGAAFAEATSARLMMEGSNPPKGLDLVLRAASHKGRSAALAAAFCPDNTEQQSRAKHYMDLILPIKAFPNAPPPALQNKEGQDGDLSTLGFDNTFSQCSPRHKTAATGGSGNGGNMSPLSMSSLNEILDGPGDAKLGAKKDAPEGTTTPGKFRLPFLTKKSSKSNDPPVEYNASRGMSQDQEMHPPQDAVDMDEDGSWTDASLDETGADAPPQSKSSRGSRKKRVFRLARFAGLAGAGAGATAAAVSSSSSSSRRSGKRGWLRRNKSKDTRSGDHSGPVVDMTPPPNVPYQSKPYQRYVPNVEVDAGSKDSGRHSSLSKELSAVVLKVRDVDKTTQERLANALSADETEHLTSYDGVKMFGQNIKTEEELEAEAKERAAKGLPPPEEIPEADSGLSKRSIKIDPQFVSAPGGDATLLTAQSWDSLLENDAARWEDMPRSVLLAPPDEGEYVGDEISESCGHDYSYSPRGGDPPQIEKVHYMAAASPKSVDSDTPGITDKYSSAEEQPIEDKYSLEEKVDGGHCKIISAANSFETEADEELMMRNEEEEEEPADQQVPDTPRRRLKLGLLSRIQSRRRSQQEISPDEEEYAVEEEDQLMESVETPSEVDEKRKPRRKLKLFKHFQNKRNQGSEEAPVYDIEYVNNQKSRDDLMLQETGTLTDADISHIEEVEVEAEEDENEVTPSPAALKAVSSDDTGDPLIRNIRKQASRIMKRGKDPSSREAEEVTRGIDP